MNRIVSSITSLQQHLDSLANNPIIYRPRVPIVLLDNYGVMAVMSVKQIGPAQHRTP